MSDEPLILPDRHGWSRSRIVFLGLSGLFALGVLWWAAEVVLPFILAVIIAYVLTPAVARCERLKIPRSLSIILVYVVTLGTIYLAVAAVAPRLYDETMKLARDAPQLGKDLSSKWGPRLESWVQGVVDRVSSQQKREEIAAEQPPGPAFEITKRPDGSFGVEVRSGIDVVEEGQGRYRVTPRKTAAGPFRVADLAQKASHEFVEYVTTNALELARFGQLLVARTARGIFLFFMTLMVAAYLMLTREQIIAFFRSLPPVGARPSFDRLLWRIDRGLAGVVRGQLLICLVNGCLSAIGFWMFGLKYWPILSIVAAVMSIIPIFGSILSTIPAVLIGLTQDFFIALWVLLWIIGIHQVEANLLNPKIIGVAAKIHPVLVVFALIVGEHFFGLWGALLAVPALSLAQSVFQHYRFQLMPDAGPDSLRPPPA